MAKVQTKIQQKQYSNTFKKNYFIIKITSVIFPLLQNSTTVRKSNQIQLHAPNWSKTLRAFFHRVIDLLFYHFSPKLTPDAFAEAAMLEMAVENFVPEKAATKLNLIKYLFICLFNELLLL